MLAKNNNPKVLMIKYNFVYHQVLGVHIAF
jgi:hypothetical protein